MTATLTMSTLLKRLAIVSSIAITIFTFGLAPSAGATYNPGNDKQVGRAGESPNGRDFGGGTRGMSDASH